VKVIREDGGDLTGIDVSAFSLAGAQTRFTDENGVASLAALPGRLTISARVAYDNFTYEPLLWPTFSVDVTAPSNYVVLIVRQPTGCISGTISNAPTLGVQPQLSSNAEFNGTNYLITGCPDGTGYYCLPAVPGLWTVSVADQSLTDFGIQSVAPSRVAVPMTGQTPSVDFVLSPIAGDFRENFCEGRAWRNAGHSRRQHQAIDPANRYGGLPFERHDIYKDRSPLYSVDKLQIPLYVGVTKNDEDVNIEEDMQLVDALRARKPGLAETMVYDNPPGGHTFDRRVDPKTWQPENTREQRDSWNRVWTFLDWNLDPFHGAVAASTK
jgi:hypothetical protein